MVSNRISMVICFILIAITGCTTTHVSQHVGLLNVGVESRIKADITVGERVHGEAKGTVLFGFINFDFPVEYADGVSYGSSSSMAFSGAVELLKSAAAYDAISKGRADILIAPQYMIVDETVLFVRTIHVIVEGNKGTLNGFKSIQ